MGFAGIASVAMQGWSMMSQSAAADNAAEADRKVAAFNADYDRKTAQQLELDTLQNISTDRQTGGEYLSAQQAGFASSGVLATTGSPLHVQITTAGRLEQKIQQKYRNMLAKRESYYAQAAAGVVYGDAQASADKTTGTLALINGGANIAGTIYKGYQNGAFGGGGGSEDTLNFGGSMGG